MCRYFIFFCFFFFFQAEDGIRDRDVTGVQTCALPICRLVDVDVLSQGTQAAAYLLLRVGLAQHMSSMSEPVPLLLDDPLVDLDDLRIDNFLDLLLDLVRERNLQILLFTKDEATRRWFERSCAVDESCLMTHLEPI